MMYQHHKEKFFKGMLLGLALGMAGGYLLREKKKKILRKMWMMKIKAKIYKRLRGLKDFTEKDFSEVVDTVINRYRGMHHVAGDELDEFSNYLKKRFEYIKEKLADADFYDEEEESDDEEEHKATDN